MEELPGDGRPRALATVGDTLVATGNGNDTPAAWVRDPGGGWVQADVAQLEGLGGLEYVAASGGLLLTIDGGGLALSEDDGRSWRPVPPPSGVTSIRVAGDEQGFLLVGEAQGGELRSLASQDGVVWDVLGLLPAPAGDVEFAPVLDVAVDGDTVVAVGSAVAEPPPAGMWVSSDRGRTWREVALSPLRAGLGLADVAVQAGRIVAAGSG